MQISYSPTIPSGLGFLVI